MKKKLLSIVLALTLATGIFAPATAAYAAATAPQQDMAAAPEILLGTPYSVTWNEQKCWFKFTVPQKGIVTFQTTNPYTNLLDYLKMNIYLYNAGGECVAYMSGNDETEISTTSWGLDAGVYYIRFSPEYDFGVGATSTYSVSLTPTENCEAEPNRGRDTATPMQLGVEEIGYLGGEQSEKENVEYDDDEDFYKVSLKKGNVYNFYFSEEKHTTIVKLLGKNSEDEETWPSTDADRFCVAPGDTFVAPYTGDYYIHVYNYSFEQYQYVTKVTNVKLAKTSIKSVKTKKAALTLKWKKVNCNGYQIQYSTKKNFKGAKTLKLSKSKTSTTLKKLSSKKKYYVRVRAYYKVKDGKAAYSGWSAVKSIKVK